MRHQSHQYWWRRLEDDDISCKLTQTGYTCKTWLTLFSSPKAAALQHWVFLWWWTSVINIHCGCVLSKQTGVLLSLFGLIHWLRVGVMSVWLSTPFPLHVSLFRLYMQLCSEPWAVPHICTSRTDYSNNNETGSEILVANSWWKHFSVKVGVKLFQ